MAGLVLTIRGRKMREMELPVDAVFTIGRGQDNMMVLDNPSVSRYHAQIEQLGHQFYVVDLGSTNGTMLNNKKIWNKALLKDQDKITVCKFDIFFMDDPLDYEHLLSGADGTETIPVAFESPTKKDCG